MSDVLTRFAPSPTGRMHVGNARTALVCFLYAQKHRGKLLLRLDDTDFERCSDEYVEDIEAGLRWMGIIYDSCFHQKDRVSRYKEVFDVLLANGVIYPCYETAEEIESKRMLQLKSGKPPIYDRAALKLPNDKIEAYKREGRLPHFRFKLRDCDTVNWNDMVRGETVISLSNFSDPVVVRSDGSYTYMLPSVIDDIDYGITHVVRGEDHVTNTALQLDMIRAIDPVKMIHFAHLPLLHDKQGKLSKRKNALSLSELRDSGFEGMTLVNYLSRLGLSKSQAISGYDMHSLIDGFELSNLSCAAAVFDLDELARLNAKVVRNMSFEQVSTSIPGLDKDFWDAIKGNIEKLNDVVGWMEICKETIVPVRNNPDLLDKAADMLREEEWDNGVWDRWITKLKAATGLKGKQLFIPLRLALTAAQDGPELSSVFAFIGKERAINRLRGIAS